jgi:hypothetical protein
MQYQTDVYPLGFPLTLKTNSHAVVKAAEQSWAPFAQSFYVPPLQLEIGVTASPLHKMPAPPSFRSRGHLMSIVTDAQNFAQCDFRSGFAYCWITAAVASESQYLRYHFLEPIALTLLAQRYLAPVHGALVVRHGQGLLLCGESSAGKSTLAYACARAGWTFITDDAVYLLRKSSRRFGVGNPHQIRFREGAKTLFSELADRVAITRPNGKVGFELSTRELGLKTAPGHRIDHVLFLNRTESTAARLSPMASAQAMEAWTHAANYGEETARHEQIKTYERLLTSHIHAFEYSRLDDAVHRLNQLAVSGR